MVIFIMSNTDSSLIGNQVLLSQYADLLNIFIFEESWTEFRQEITKSVNKSDRKLMPGIKKAEIIHFPESKSLVETPKIIISIQGHDDNLYEWEGTIVLDKNTGGFKPIGQIHMVSEPEINFLWTPSFTNKSVS